MLNRYFRTSAAYVFCSGLLAAGVIANPSPVFAQACDAPYEMITRLHHPEPGAFMVWNTLYGEEGRQEKFVSAIGRENGKVLAVGEVQVAKGVKPSLLLVEFDRRGRKIWEKTHAVSNLDEIVKILPYGEAGYVVLVNKKTSQKHEMMWMGFFDGKGKLTAGKNIQAKGVNLRANDLQPKVGGDGWAMPVLTSSQNDNGAGNNQKNASVLILDKNGNQKNTRSYVLGKTTNINSLSVAKFDGDTFGYIATGYFENNNGKEIGWVLRLDEDLSIVWQKEFSRGVSAKVMYSVPDKDGDVYVAANIGAADSDSDGVWFAKLDGASGNMPWQRYYMSENGAHHYNVRGLNVNKDGLVALLMMAEAVDEDEQPQEGAPQKDKMSGFGITSESDYGHLLTLSPRGITLSGDAFYYGQGVSLSQLSESKDGQRIIVGHSFVKPDMPMTKKVGEDPSVEKPLNELGDVRLPDVDLSDNTKKGLALLQKKISAQALIDQKEDKDNHDESAKNIEKRPSLVQKGWVVIGDMPDPYVDPCK